jgi:hypothetical protein
MKLKIAVACPGELRDLSDRKPVSDEELKNTFGMDGYLIDFVEAPPYLKKYLCAEHDIHEIPVALERANEGRLANSRKFKKFAVGENMYTVKFKNYGSGSRQTSVFHFYPPRYLGSSSKFFFYPSISLRVPLLNLFYS